MSELAVNTTIESMSVIVVSVVTPTFSYTIDHTGERTHSVAHASQVHISIGSPYSTSPR